MEKQIIEDRIKTMYQEEAAKLQLPESVKLQIDHRIKEVENKKTVRLWGKKKLVILVAAVMLILSSVGCYALGTSMYSKGQANALPDTTDFKDVSKITKEAGFSFHAVEHFSNGYSFQGLRVSTAAEYDEKGKILGEEYHSLIFDYTNGDKKFTLFMKPFGGEILSPKNAVEEKEIEGNQVYFTKYVNKIVPQNYQMTQEDMEREKQGDFGVSCTSDQETIEEMTSYTLSWQENEIEYYITDYEGLVSYEDMEEVARQIMNAGKK